MSLSRRQVLSRGAAGLGVLAAGNVAGMLGASPAFAKGGRSPWHSNGNRPGNGYGALQPDPAGLLDLPRGFSYEIVSVEGESLPGGGVVPGRFDGTAAFPALLRGTDLVRNSEYGSAYPAATPVVGDPSITYDPGNPADPGYIAGQTAVGGTTTVRLDRHNHKVDEFVSLAGTTSNCAGGPTLWDTWLTCEEDESKAGQYGQAKDHGFVFEVDPATPSNTIPVPITGMGRFAHEAVAMDPRDGLCYLTEDAGHHPPFGLFYRYVPNDLGQQYGALHNGGVLTAMKCSQGGVHVPDLQAYSTVGDTLDVQWVPIPDPLAAAVSIRNQFADSEVTRASKLEGAFYGDGKIWFDSSFVDDGPHHHAGQVWSYDPEASTITLEVYFPQGNLNGAVPGDSPDNICYSPYGGLILAEDSGGENFLLAVDEHGGTSPLARNARELGVEFTGPTFSPDNRTLFANLQEPGITFAISGPFARIHRA